MPSIPLSKSALGLVCALALCAWSGHQVDQEAIALAWIAAHNSGSVETMAEYRAQHRQQAAADDWRESFARRVERWGRLEVIGVMIDQANEVMMRVASENAGTMRLVFRFDGDAPDQLTAIMLDDGGGRRTNPLPELQLPADPTARATAIDQYLSGLVEQDVFSGVALIAERGEVSFERAYGLASREFEVPNTLATRFDVGSFNKDYTRLAIMQLLQQDRLALTDTVGEHVPDYPNERVRNEVTIEQLIDHRGGLGDYFTQEWRDTPMGSLREIDDYLPIWGPKPLEYEPGTREQYSNFGYTVLGAIIESISGMSYPEYVEQHVFAPAGMADSGFFETDVPEPDVAVGYTYMVRGGRRTDTLRKNIYLEPAKGGPWGKSYSTARDLYRFFEAMFDGKLIPDDLNWLRSGWDSGGIGLAGGGPGLNAYLLLQNGQMVIVMTNMDPPSAGHVAERLLEAVEASS